VVTKENTNVFIDGLVPKTLYTFNITAMFTDGPGQVNRLKIETGVDGKSFNAFLYRNKVFF